MTSKQFYIDARYRYILDQISRLNSENQKAFFSFVIIASLSSGALSAIYTGPKEMFINPEMRKSAAYILSAVNTTFSVLFMTIILINLVNWYRYRCDEVVFLNGLSIEDRKSPQLKNFLLWTETWYCVAIFVFIAFSWFFTTKLF